MAKQKRMITTKAGLIFKCIWLVVATFFFIVGMTIFLKDKSFAYWLAWGFLCSIPMVVDIIKVAVEGAKDGARRGANSYTATVSSSGVTVQNHPFREAVIGTIFSLLGGFLVGPIMLGVYMIAAIFQIIGYIRMHK